MPVLSAIMAAMLSLCCRRPFTARPLPLYSLNQVFRVERLQFLQYEYSVFSHEHVIEPYLSAAVLRPLYADQVPVDRRFVAVAACRSSRRE